MAHQSIADDLRQTLGQGVQVTGRRLDLLARAHDASHYLLHPRAVVTPRTTDQVAEVLRACSRLGLPLTFRGEAISDVTAFIIRTPPESRSGRPVVSR